MQNRAPEEKQEQPIDNPLAPLKMIDGLEVKLQNEVKLTALSPETLAIYPEHPQAANCRFTYLNVTTKEQEVKQEAFGVGSHEVGFNFFYALPSPTPSIGFTDIPSFLYAKHSGNPLNHPSLRHMRYATIMPDQEHLALWGTRYHSLTIVIFNLTHSIAYRHVFPLFGHIDGECQILPASNQQLFVQQGIKNAGVTFKFKLYALHFDSADGIPNYRAKPKLSGAIYVRTQHLSMSISPDGNWLATIHQERPGVSTLCISAYDTQQESCLRQYDYLGSTVAWGDTLAREIASAPTLSGHWLPDSTGYVFNKRDEDNQRYYSYHVDMNMFATLALCEPASSFSMANDGSLWVLKASNHLLGLTYSTKSTAALKASLSSQIPTLPTVLIDIIADYTIDFRFCYPTEFTPSPRLPETLQDEMKNLMVKYTGNKAEYKKNISALTFFNNLVNSNPYKTPAELVRPTQEVYWNFFSRKHRHPCSRFFKAVIQQEEAKETIAPAPSLPALLSF